MAECVFYIAAFLSLTHHTHGVKTSDLYEKDFWVSEAVDEHVFQMSTSLTSFQYWLQHRLFQIIFQYGFIAY